MPYSYADLEMASRHVAEAERHILDQEKLITTLRLRGQPTEAADALLFEFNETLVLHRRHRDEIEYALARH